VTDRRRDVLAAIATAVVALVVAALVLQLWRADPNVPFEDRADALHNEQIIRSGGDGGWYLHDDVVGAPLGADLRDFPVTTDLLHLAAMKVVTAVTSVPARAMNAWYVLSFPAVAVVAFVVLRALRTSRRSAAVAAVLFAVLPYHFVRGEDHLYLATYVGVPIGCWLVLSALRGTPWASRGVVVAAAIAVGWTSLYYAAFTIVLLVIAGASVAATARHWRAAVPALAVAAVVLVAAGATLLPSMTRRIADGPNLEVGQRAATESESYALKLTELVLPISHHRLGALAEVKERYVQTALGNPGEHPDTATLGLVGTVGMALAAGTFVVAGFGGRRPRSLDLACGAAVLASFLVGTVGGISSLVGYLVTPQFRAWGRISTFIAFFSLVVVARLLDRALERRSIATRPWLAAAVPVVLLAVGVLDQTTTDQVPDYEGVGARREAVADFVGQAELALPDGASVLQLPYMPFPESPPLHGMESYDHFRPMLASTDLRWSFGAMNGRPEDWSASLEGQGVRRQVVAAAAAGLAAVEVDRRGFADPAAATTEIEDVLGPPLVDSGDRWVLYDLRPLARELADDGIGSETAEAVLHAPVVAWGPGFYPSEVADDRTWRWAGGEASLTIDNPTDDVLEVALTADLFVARPEGATVTVSIGDAPPLELPIDADGRALRRSIPLPPGSTPIRFEVDGEEVRAAGDPRDLALRVEDLQVTSDAVAELWDVAGV
jgi:phosphoglycerol transferase